MLKTTWPRLAITNRQRHSQTSRSHPSLLFHHHHRRNINISSSNKSRPFKGGKWTLDDATGIVLFNNEPRFQTIIGLEIHAQLNIPTKLFSPALTTSNNAARPNDYDSLLLHPFDAAIPGFLPVLSRDAVQAALVAATVLNCDIAATSRFERKHYPYADLPHGYQMTQQRWPLARNGFVQASVVKVPRADKTKISQQKSSNNTTGNHDANTVTCRINRIQLEQDTGKTTTTATLTTSLLATTNQQEQQQGQQRRVMLESSRVDLNRAGCALLEIVTEPDIRTPYHAACMVETLRQLLAHVHVCTGRMERGQLRVDLNVNIQDLIMDHSDHDISDETTTRRKRPRRSKRSSRVEVKNLNSIRQVQQAAEYEVLRQAREWQNHNDNDDNDNDSSDDGDNNDPRQQSLLSLQETRTWNASTKQTVLIRRKDQAHDYRFLPEPDLPPLVLYPPSSTTTSTRDDDSIAVDTNETKNNIINNHHAQHTGDDADYLFPNQTVMHDYIKATMPELPAQAVQRLVSQYALSEYQARVITSDPPAIAFFDRAYASAMRALRHHDKASAAATVAASMVANYLCNDLFSLLKDHQQHRHHHVDDNDEESFDSTMGGGSIQDSFVTAEQLGEVVALVMNGTISKTMAKNLLAILYNAASNTTSNNRADDNDDGGNRPLSVAQIAANHGFQLVSDPVQLHEHVRKVLKSHVEAHDLERYFTMDHKVQAKLLKFFTGQCMAASKGNAEPEALREALEQVLLQMQQERNQNGHRNDI